jgi:hypothetical protein
MTASIKILVKRIYTVDTFAGLCSPLLVIVVLLSNGIISIELHRIVGQHGWQGSLLSFGIGGTGRLQHGGLGLQTGQLSAAELPLGLSCGLRSHVQRFTLQVQTFWGYIYFVIPHHGVGLYPGLIWVKRMREACCKNSSC